MQFCYEMFCLFVISYTFNFNIKTGLISSTSSPIKIIGYKKTKQYKQDIKNYSFLKIKREVINVPGASKKKYLTSINKQAHKKKFVESEHSSTFNGSSVLNSDTNYEYSSYNQAKQFWIDITYDLPGLSNLNVNQIQQPDELVLKEVKRLQEMLILQYKIGLLKIDIRSIDMRLRLMSYKFGKNVIEKNEENIRICNELANKLRDLTNEYIFKELKLRSLREEQIRKRQI